MKKWFKLLLDYFLGAAKHSGRKETADKVNQETEAETERLVKESERISSDPNHKPSDWR